MKRFSLYIAIMVLFSGCETITEFSDDRPQLVAAPDSVSAMLADAADRASNALETLAAIEQTRTPESSVAPVAGAPLELRRAITINWVGPVDQITKTLADRAGYSFTTIGSTPPNPIVVSVDTENMPIIDVLRDLGLQLGQRANITVDGSRRVVELNYPSAAGGF